MKNLIVFGIALFSVFMAQEAMAATNNPYAYPYYTTNDTAYQYFQYSGYSPEPVKKETKKTDEGTTVINNYYYYTDGSNVPVLAGSTTNNNGYVTSNKTNTTNNHLSEYQVYAYNGTDGAYPNYMSASALGAYNNQNNNVKNSNHGFLPNSFGQWVLTIILILAIIVVYRVIMRQFKKEKPA